MSATHDDLEDEEEHEEHVNHEAWVIPYADMLTLLMALFLMLFAISSVDLQKFEALADSLANEFGTGGAKPSIVEGGQGVLDGAGPEPVTVSPARIEEGEQALAREEAEAAAAAAATQRLDDIEQQVAERAGAAGLLDSIGFRRESRGLVVSIVADEVMFQAGAAEVQPAGASILREVVLAIKGMPNELIVEGHTDNVPISTSQFASNWELSTARATEVLRYLVEELDLDPARVSAAGYGEERPIATNDTPEGRTKNRRVEIAILSK